MSQLQIVLLAIAGFAAILTLAKLMLARQKNLIQRLQVEAEAARKKAVPKEEPRAKRKAG